MKRTKAKKNKKNKNKNMKSVKWHGNEEQMDIYVYHMLQSCGV